MRSLCCRQNTRCQFAAASNGRQYGPMIHRARTDADRSLKRPKHRQNRRVDEGPALRSNCVSARREKNPPAQAHPHFLSSRPLDEIPPPTTYATAKAERRPDSFTKANSPTARRPAHCCSTCGRVVAQEIASRCRLAATASAKSLGPPRVHAGGNGPFLTRSISFVQPRSPAEEAVNTRLQFGSDLRSQKLADQTRRHVVTSGPGLRPRRPAK